MANKQKTRQAVKTSARDVLKGWNDYYANNDFGLGIQCSLCHKWRLTYQYEESKDVPENWTCFQWVNDENKNGCHIASHLTEDDFAQEEYPPGTLVWAKLPGFFWWPAMIEDSPDTQDFFMILESGEEAYHVNFFSERPQRSWIKASHIIEFSDKLPKASNKLFRPSRTLMKSIKQAKEALNLPIKERLLKYSFAVRYNGRWAKFKDEDDVSLPPKCPPLKELAKLAAETQALNANHSVNGNDRQAPTPCLRRRAFGVKRKFQAKREVVNEEDDKASANQGDATKKEPMSEKDQLSFGDRQVKTTMTTFVFKDFVDRFKCHPSVQVYKFSRKDVAEIEDQPCSCQSGKGTKSRNEADGVKKEPVAERDEQTTQSVDKVDGNGEAQLEGNGTSVDDKGGEDDDPENHVDFGEYYEILLGKIHPPGYTLN